MHEAIIINHVSKEYKLGQIGGGTLTGDLQSWWAKINHKEDPNLKIGTKSVQRGEKFLAIDDLSFKVNKGERVGLIGHNGAGKSTLLKLLSRVTAPTKGEIHFAGRIASMLEVGTGFHPELTGRENVYMNGAILGMSKEEIDRKFDAIVRFAEMEKFIDTPVKRYSSGMYVKLAFSVAAHLDSEIMIMDEVLAVGDMKFQQKCLGKMSEVSQNEGRTILYVSHNMNTIRQLCNRCIVLEHGKLLYDGDVETAIDIYLNNVQNYNACVNLTDVMRGDELGKEARFTEFEFLNGTINLETGDCVKAKIGILGNKDIDNVHIRINLKASDGAPLAMYNLSEKITIEKGMKYFDIVFDTAQLAPGTYTIDLVLNETNEFGTERLIDVVRKSVGFNINAAKGFNGNMEWLPQFWGHYSGKIELLGEQ